MAESGETKNLPVGIDISDKDIYEAMKDIRGYLDITPADLKEIYKFAYGHALERLTRSVKASDIMTSKVFSVRRTDPAREVARLMAEHRISGVPVLDADGRVAGVISEKDFLARMGVGGKTNFMAVIAECLLGEGCVTTSVRSQKAEDIMTSPSITVRADATASEISTIFTGRKINRVPVTDGEGRLIGIVSRSDVVRALMIRGNASAEGTEASGK